MGAGGPVQKVGFLLIFPKVSQLRYMLLHKLYINLAIAIICILLSSLSDLSLKICPIPPPIKLLIIYYIRLVFQIHLPTVSANLNSLWSSWQLRKNSTWTLLFLSKMFHGMFTRALFVFDGPVNFRLGLALCDRRLIGWVCLPSSALAQPLSMAHHDLYLG